MPELPEVETTLRGISKRILNKQINSFEPRTEKLRWPINKNLKKFLKNKKVCSAERRGKYIIKSFKRASINSFRYVRKT